MRWCVPDRVFVPVGNGCIVGAIYKGFHELMLMGVTDRMPKIMGVQAKGSNFMYRTWKAGKWTSASPPSTLASSISVALPRDRIKALRAITLTGGEFIVVNDEEILLSVISLARSSGVFAEPGAAAAYAAYKKWDSYNNEISVIVITGSGLKDTGTLIKSGLLDAEYVQDKFEASYWANHKNISNYAHLNPQIIGLPSVVRLDDLLPSDPLLMMEAGSVPLPSWVAKANSEMINHLVGTMAKVIKQLKNSSLCFSNSV